jgi:hypothetical protein
MKLYRGSDPGTPAIFRSDLIEVAEPSRDSMIDSVRSLDNVTDMDTLQETP